MKKIILIGATVLALGACTETTRTASYGCASCGAAFAVKTGTEIIDHYQMYQPVVSYRPAGTFTNRRTVSAISNNCGQTRTRRTPCTY